MSSKDIPCKYHFKGACVRGDACNFSHQQPSTICRYCSKATCINGNKCSNVHSAEPMNSGSISGGDSKEADPSFHSNEFSDREKESDSSNRGWDGDAGDQRGTDSDRWDDGALEDQQPEDNPKNEKPKAPCHFFLLGDCFNGDNCGFAHSTPVSRNEPREAGIEKPSPFVQIPIRKKEICKYHMMGKCRKGTQCALKHPRNDKQRLLELASRNRYDSTSRPFQPANSTSVASKSTPVSPSTSTWQADLGEDVSDTQATDAEPIDADEDNDNQSKDQDDSNHSEIDEQGARDIDLPASPHNRRRTEEIQTRDVLPDIPRQRVDEPTQPPTVHYPHVSEVSLHWSQFADPLANPEIAFCKFHAQGQCVQGESCSFRHSITVQEYFMLFRDQQPNLCTLSRDRSAQNALHQRVPPLSSSTLSPSYYPALPQVPATLVQPPSSPFSRECNFYRLGTCRNNPCPYLHTDPPAEVENRPGRSEQRERSIPDTPAPTQAKSTSTQPLCRYIGSKRGCTRSDCRFSHGDSFGNSYPSSGPSGPQSSTGPVIEEKDNGWNNDNDNGWTNDNWGKNDAENNGWGEPIAGGTPWDNDASTLHCGKDWGSH